MKVLKKIRFIKSDIVYVSAVSYAFIMLCRTGGRIWLHRGWNQLGPHRVWEIDGRSAAGHLHVHQCHLGGCNCDDSNEHPRTAPAKDPASEELQQKPSEKSQLPSSSFPPCTRGTSRPGGGRGGGTVQLSVLRVPLTPFWSLGPLLQCQRTPLCRPD